MLKLSTILILTITFNKIHSSDVANVDCDPKKCENIENCPIGTFLSFSRPELGICCNTCREYAKLGEPCNGTNYCSPILHCPFFGNVTVCSYIWENTIQSRGCGTTLCPTYKECPKNSFLIKNDGEKRCCDQCIPYSRYGEYCDEKQQCQSGLNCLNNICWESEECASKKETCEVIKDCPSDTFLVKANGIDRCCDVCQTYSKLGEKCNDSVYCDKELFCDYGPNECIKLEVNCESAYCPPENELNCDKNKSYMVPKNGKDVCCSYCQPYANYGEFCNEDRPCISKFVCKNNTCDLTNECNCI
ncbi:prion-like-(Q/N-rich) domain-bearing protein 25 [Chrysoperla carnea]|uniref:prion-like-(Q/N-rich) domain-bearing protein 25 n=1 Tax=Chrysoperla carnea TaxID=189513 RepID=UPI001D079361|nr:prion-like-(Q/N-rich) domain-bearing protein 25 [Chrysoperla carnea]